MKILSSEDEVLLFRDFREIAAVDREGVLLRHQIHAARQCLHFGRDADGWSYLTMDHTLGVTWHHSALGQIPWGEEFRAGPSREVSMSADGRTVAVALNRREIVIARRSDDGTVASQPIPCSGQIDKLHLSAHGRRIALRLVNRGWQWLDLRDETLHAWSPSQTGMPLCHGWSRDEEWFALATDQGCIDVWRADVGSQPRYTLRDQPWVSSLMFGSDGRWLFAGTSTGELHAWRDGERAWSTQVHAANIRALDLSEDDRYLVSGSLDGRLLIHSAETGEFVRELPNHSE
ncbi:MAG: WD40 repeat domain-containing protein [Planctomycetaceae bacterium]